MSLPPCPHCGDASLMPFCDYLMSQDERDRPNNASILALGTCGDPIVDAVRHKLRMPDDDDPICASIAHKLAERSRAGQLKYGTKLTRADLTQLDWLNHAQEEAMDLANYLEVLIQRALPWSTSFDQMQEQALSIACHLQCLLEQCTSEKGPKS